MEQAMSRIVYQTCLIKKRSTGNIKYYFTFKEDIKNEKLKNYLLDVYCKGLYMEAMDSASQCPTLLINKRKIDHELTRHAKAANYEGLQDLQHLTVQQYLLKNDPYTIGYEIPCNDGITSCFIDVVREEPDGMIGVWDFKPNAKAEKHASTQLYWNMRLLSKATKIPFNQFKGGYFDNMNCYQLIF